MSVEKMIDVAQKQCNITCYVWGAKGQDMNTMSDAESWVQQMEKEDAEKSLNVQKIMARFRKLQGQGINPIRAFDCSGLVWYCLNQAGFKYSRTSAKHYFSMCKEIGKADLRKGDFVFHDSNGVITHIGIYVGDGEVIHSKGRQYGVVQEPMSVYKNWNRFGYLDDVRESANCSEKPTSSEKPNNLPYLYFKGSFNVREEPSTDSRKVCIIHKGASADLLGYADNGWYEVEINGKHGFVSNNPKYRGYIEVHNEEAF